MAVAFDVASESHTGTTGSSATGAFSWSHAGGASARGALVFVFSIGTPTDTSVTYGGTSMTLIPYTAYDSDTEPGSVRAYYLDNCGTGTKTVTVNRTNNSVVMYGACFTVTSNSVPTDVYLPGVKTQAASGAVQTAASATGTGASSGWTGLGTITDNSPGTNSVRFMGVYQGSSNSLASSTGTTKSVGIDFGLYCIDTYYETTAGQGARALYTASLGDDLAAIGLAVYEKSTKALTPAAIDTGEAFGTTVVANVYVAQNVTGSSIASEEAFGTAVLTPGAVSITGTGIASLEAFGTTALTPGPVGITGAGIASEEAFGTSAVTPGPVSLTGASIDSEEAFGTTSLTPGAVSLTGAGIESEEAFGTTSLTPGAVGLTLTGIVSAEAFGTTDIALEGTSSYYDDVMALSPTSYWRLGETSGTGAADEQSLNPGTYYNSPTLGADGALAGDDDTSITFDAANEYMGAGNDASLQANYATLILWFRTSDAGTGYRRFFSKDGAYGLFTNNNVFGTYIWGQYSGWKSSGVDVADGEWHMGALTIQPVGIANSKLYLDGQLVWDNLGDVSNQNWPLNVGDGHNLGQNPTASVDEAAIWVGSSNILTGEEIAALYEAGTTTTIPQAVSPTGIESAEAFGTTAITASYAITVAAIDTAEALGTTAVTSTYPLAPAGIESEEALGTSAVTSTYPITNAGNISSEAVLGGVTVTYTYPITNVGGISTQEALGATVLSTSYPITVSGIESEEALGATTVQGAVAAQAIVSSGIPSDEAFGSTVVGHTAAKLTEVSDGLAALIRSSAVVRNVYPMPYASVQPTCAVVGFPTRVDYDLAFNCSIVEIELPIWFVIGANGTKESRDAMGNILDSMKALLDGHHSWGSVRVTKATIDSVSISGLLFDTVKMHLTVID